MFTQVVVNIDDEKIKIMTKMYELIDLLLVVKRKLNEGIIENKIRLNLQNKEHLIKERINQLQNCEIFKIN